MTSLAVKVRYLDGQSADYEASRVVVKDSNTVLTLSYGHARLFSALSSAVVTITTASATIDPIMVGDGLMKVDRDTLVITVFH